MTGRHMITAIQATREAGVRSGRVIARSTVNRWTTNPPTATTAPTSSSDAPLIMAPPPHIGSAAEATNVLPDRPVRIGARVKEAAGTDLPTTSGHLGPGTTQT